MRRFLRPNYQLKRVGGNFRTPRRSDVKAPPLVDSWGREIVARRPDLVTGKEEGPRAPADSLKRSAGALKDTSSGPVRFSAEVRVYSGRGVTMTMTQQSAVLTYSSEQRRRHL